jgi:predicted phosphodiesterase
MGNPTIEQIAPLVSKHGKRWNKIGRKLNANPEQVRAMYRRYERRNLSESQIEPPQVNGYHVTPLTTEYTARQPHAIRIAFPTDQHYPYQDDYARSVALQIVRDFNPHLFISGSDGIDFYAVSSFDKSPERVKQGGLQREIDAWIAGEREWMDATPNAKRVFIEGNHEDRLRRYLWQHHEIADLRAMQLSHLLEFDKLKLIHMRSNEIIVGRLLIRHGSKVSANSAYTAKGELESERYDFNLLTGHTHRMGAYYVKKRDEIVQAHECGCLCRLDTEYVARPNWQNGFMLATVFHDTVSFEPVVIHTINGRKKAFWRGREYHEE